jgi:hypothetical protein
MEAVHMKILIDGWPDGRDENDPIPWECKRGADRLSENQKADHRWWKRHHDGKKIYRFTDNASEPLDGPHPYILFDDYEADDAYMAAPLGLKGVIEATAKTTTKGNQIYIAEYGEKDRVDPVKIKKAVTHADWCAHDAECLDFVRSGKTYQQIESHFNWGTGHRGNLAFRAANRELERLKLPKYSKNNPRPKVK